MRGWPALKKHWRAGGVGGGAKSWRVGGWEDGRGDCGKLECRRERIVQRLSRPNPVVRCSPTCCFTPVICGCYSVLARELLAVHVWSSNTLGLGLCVCLAVIVWSSSGFGLRCGPSCVFLPQSRPQVVWGGYTVAPLCSSVGWGPLRVVFMFTVYSGLRLLEGPSCVFCCHGLVLLW